MSGTYILHIQVKAVIDPNTFNVGISIQNVNGGWNNTIVTYDGNFGNSDACIIDIPSYLETYGRISSIVSVVPNFSPFKLQATLLDNPSRIAISVAPVYLGPSSGWIYQDLSDACWYRGQPDLPLRNFTLSSLSVFVMIAQDPNTLMNGVQDFSLSYIRGYNNVSNNAVRMDMNGLITYDNKYIEPLTIMSNVDMGTVAGLSNAKLQYLFTVTLTNNNGIVNVGNYNTSTWPSIISITNNTYSIIATSTSNIPYMEVLGVVSRASVTIPTEIDFIPIFDSDVLYLTCNTSLNNLIGLGQSLTMTFLLCVPIVIIPISHR